MKQLRLLASIAAGSLLLGSSALAQADPKKTERLWKSKCAPCHGAVGQGDTEKGRQLKIVDMTSPAFQAKKDEELRKAILDGVAKEKGHTFKGELTPEQVDALVGHIRGFKK
jgi:mono/diheme cytochrome c family protein